MRLIIATKNKGKFREIKRILTGLEIEVVSMGELGENVKIIEDGSSFFENARKKAMTVSRKYPFDLVAGEDSGIEVKYLDNRPGIFSKRYSGKDSTYLKNNLKLLKELKGVERRERRARFRCVIALARGAKITGKFEGRISGYINDKISGRSGFGYDPVFYLPSYKKTMAQISLDKKNEISHRARAFFKLKNFLANYLKNK